MVAFPFCKINLGLNVVARRQDGYHDLETCFFPVPWTDVLEIVPADSLSYSGTGLAIPGRPEDNLCLKAYALLQREFDLPPVAMHLHKIIPPGAGLGGGSSDATFCLKILSDVFALELPEGTLLRYASQLGSDCPYFMFDTPMMGQGRGERLTPLPLSLKDKQLVIVKPQAAVGTADAFRGLQPEKPDYDLAIELQKPVKYWRDRVKNDFEKSIFRSHPDLAELKQALYRLGAAYASMTGSGAALYGIFEQPVLQLETTFPDCIYWSGTL